MALVLYQDSPHYDIATKLILAGPVCLLLFLAIWFAEQGQHQDALISLGMAVFMTVLYWAISPRSYQVLEDRMRIVLGGPFSLDFAYDTIETARVSSAWFLGLSFSTALAWRHVEIVRKKGMNVGVTPSNYAYFVESLNRALEDWRSRRR